MCKRGYKGWEMPNCPPNGTGCGNGGDVSVRDDDNDSCHGDYNEDSCHGDYNDDDSSDCGQGYKS